MIEVFYSPAYTAAGYSFDTTRKAGWIAESLTALPIAGIELVEPKPLTATEVSEVHDPAYVRAIETGTPRELAESQGFEWDQGLWPAVLASTGGVVAAALRAVDRGISGSLSGGLHHARYGSGAGFCTFNGLAIAAKKALASGVAGVLILDFDAHCGGGTAALIRAEPRIRQVDVSVDEFDRYAATESNSLDIVRDSASYLATIERRLDQVAQLRTSYDLCLYNAGMDPHEDCQIGGQAGITAEVLAARERMVFSWAKNMKLPIALVIAGGYVGGKLDKRRLVDLHRLTLATASQLFE